MIPHQPPLMPCFNDFYRPAGFDITDRALALAQLPPRARIADIGCGLGPSVRHLREVWNLHALGIERDWDKVHRASTPFVFAGDGTALPFGDNTMDALLFECSLSKMHPPEQVLAQCRRVLKPGGCLIVTDLYARGTPATLAGLLGRVERRETLEQGLASAGFTPEHFEDYSRELAALWGQLIFQHGKRALHQNLCCDGPCLKQIRCGYCLILSRKEKS